MRVPVQLLFDYSFEHEAASNSLLEGLVFGARAAAGAPPQPRAVTQVPTPTSGGWPAGDPVVTTRASASRDTLRATMFASVGVLRDAAGLDVATIAATTALADVVDLPDCRPVWEVRNLATASLAITAAARHRTESRGAHFRTDHPMPDPALAGQHSLREPGASEVWRFGSLDEDRGSPAT